MIIKYIPEDFYVKEIIKFPKQNTNFIYFLMWKKNLTTIRAIKIVARYLRISKKRISFAGEKDKKAVTEQYISIKNLESFEERIDLGNIKLRYIGAFSEPVSLKILKGNYFRIVVRDLNEEDIKKFHENFERIKNYGFINYFDEQRFGDIRCNNHLIGKAIIKRDFEEAIKILLTFYSEFENEKAREARLFAKENWGNWREIIKKFPKWLDVELAVLNYLIRNPKDFKGALLKIHKKLLKLLINSYQSYLFNLALSKYLKNISKSYKCLKLSFGEVTVPLDKNVLHSLENKEFPIIGYDSNLDEFPEYIRKIYKDIINTERISLANFKFDEKELRFLSAGGDKRKILIRPNSFSFSIQDDDIFSGKCKIVLEFELPKGVYATMLIKQLFI